MFTSNYQWLPVIWPAEVEEAGPQVARRHLARSPG